MGWYDKKGQGPTVKLDGGGKELCCTPAVFLREGNDKSNQQLMGPKKVRLASMVLS